MSAHESLGPQFQEQGESPLQDYGYTSVRRAGIVDPHAGPPPKSDIYFAGGEMRTTRSRSQVGGAVPGTVAFADYSKHGQHLNVHYMKTRDDQRGQGHATALVRQLIERHTPESVDFGYMSHEATHHVKNRMEKEFPKTYFRGRVDY